MPHTRKLLNFSGSRNRVKGSSSVASIFLIAVSDSKYALVLREAEHSKTILRLTITQENN